MIKSEGEWSGPEYLDTTDTGKKNETKAYTFHRMESEEVCERYITPCFMEGLDAFDGVTDLEYEKNLILNEFVVKLGLTYEVMKNGEKVMDPKLLVSLKGELYFVDFVVNPEEDDVEPCVKSLRNKKKSTKTYKMSYDSKGPSLTINRPKTQEELTREEMEEELYERIMLHNQKRPIIETLKYGDKHKKLLDSVLLDKLKLDEEFELEEEIYDFHVLVDTGSNLNVMPYRIYELLDRDNVKLRSDKKKVVSFLGTLPVSLKNTDWKPNYSGRNLKEEGDRKWHVNVKVIDPFGNAFKQGFETKETDIKVSGCYKLIDIMSPSQLVLELKSLRNG
ncbi:reverse transcriptase domain-containing protein [Tanacetum coccineum]